MPVPKRYFHVSQELNHDPELWEFTAEFGDRALRTWMQILVYLDRSANQWRTSGDWLATLSRTVRQSVANVSRQIRWLSEKGWLTVGEATADGSPLVFAAPKWAQYNRRQEHKRNASVPDSGTLKERIDIPSFPAPTPNLSFPTPKNKKEERIKSSVSAVPAKAAPKTEGVWESYRSAYELRYGAPPIRNASVNGILSRLVDRLGVDVAPAVATFYVQHNNPFYVGKRHPVSLLLADAEGLHTQWVTGVKATTGEAKNAERRDDAQAQIARVKAAMGEV